MIRRLARKRLHRPEAVRLVLRDLLRRRGPALHTRRHLDEAAKWLLRAQDATPDGGVSAGHSFEDGWIASYPETTGYIIPTFLEYARLTGDGEVYRTRAVMMAEWELGLQHPSGGFPGHFVDREHPPIAFNTGQIIFGLLAAFEATDDKRFLESALRAARWLVEVQEADGAWRRSDYLGHTHSYNTRSAWALAELGVATGDADLVNAARRHLDWACGQQHDTGWFEHASFRPGEAPLLHTIAYTSQGLLEAGLRLNEQRYVEAAERACRAVLDAMTPEGWIAARFDEAWRPAATYSCLTGNAQMAVQWFRLHATTGAAEFLEGGRRATTFLKTLQDCETSNLAVRGAIKGSHPIWGRYLFGTFPNWAAKFFMDALLFEDASTRGEAGCTRCW